MRKKTGYIQKRGRRSYRIRYYSNDGIRQSETIKGDREDAERELAIRLGEIAKGLQVSSKPNTVLMGELMDDVVTDYEVNGYSSVDDIETRFRLHLEPVFGKRKASQITTAMIRRYTKDRLAEGAAAGTVNRELEALRHAFLMAIEEKKLLVAPHVPMLREKNVRTGFFTREEIERLTAHLKEPLASMTWFGFFTGWRLEECRGLTWDRVDFAKNEIRLWPRTDKNEEGRVFPLSAELRGLLITLKESARTTPDKAVASMTANQMPAPTHAINPKVFLGIGDFRKAWKTACHLAQIPGTIVEPVKKGGKRGAVKVLKAGRTFHDLRRSFAREMSNRGAREGAIMKLAGWKTRSVFDRYNIVSESDLRDAVALMDDHKTSTKTR